MSQDPGRPYGQPYAQPSPPYAAAAPQHPDTTTVLVLGVVALVAFPILGPVAWFMGNRVVREIDASQGRLGGRSNANLGRILGIVASALLVFVVLAFLLVAGTFVLGATV